VIFVIDTSATMTAHLALIDESGSGRSETCPTSQLAGRMRSMTQGRKLTAVAVATGPGSFTGLRVGVSFGLGLAIGLRIPIIPLPSLDLQAARSGIPVTAVLEAGRGRVYYQLPGGKPVLGEPADIPASHPLVGNVTPKTEAALIAARHHFLPEGDLRDFSQAAASMLETAREVSYGSLEIEYMQSFTAKP
jgi:tRNA threonylcarbamoyladenosine biosynthesis protein TsaB